MKTLSFFKWDFLITAIALAIAYWYAGIAGATLATMLIIVEVVFSFDNAAVNAAYLTRMSLFWRRMFLTVGILIAVFGMRLVFPFAIVCITGQVSPLRAIELAIAKGDSQTPGTYGYLLNEAHTSIAAFGGMFLLMLFLSFLFNPRRQTTWLGPIEKLLIRLGQVRGFPTIIAGISLITAAQTLPHDHLHATASEDKLTILLAGLGGIITYLAVNGVAEFMEERQEAINAELQSSGAETALLTGKAAFSMFMFLEVLDASFSFDGVIGAFAITPDPVIIGLGLGVGAIFVRSMTVYLVNEGTLTAYPYLEHGAHWAIGALAVLLITTIRFHIPEVVIGFTGIGFIALAFLSSLRARNNPQID